MTSSCDTVNSGYHADIFHCITDDTGVWFTKCVLWVLSPGNFPLFRNLYDTILYCTTSCNESAVSSLWFRKCLAFSHSTWQWRTEISHYLYIRFWISASWIFEYSVDLCVFVGAIYTVLNISFMNYTRTKNEVDLRDMYHEYNTNGQRYSWSISSIKKLTFLVVKPEFYNKMTLWWLLMPKLPG